MIKKMIMLILLAKITVITNAQGIKFENNLTWNELKERARLENKYIFIDCFTTWCSPCKLMDNEVYTSRIVGAYMDDKFLSIKVQMDSTDLDNEQTKIRHKEASDIQSIYQVESFPTFLFFNVEGEFVHRFSGAIRDSDFLKVAANSLIPERQYATLINNYKFGKKEYNNMTYLINLVENTGNKELAKEIFNDYKENYLNKINEQEVFTKKNLNVISKYEIKISTSDNIFKLLREKANNADEIMGYNISERIINAIITREEINSILWPDGIPITNEPDWKRIKGNIEKKYGVTTSDKTILEAQLRWYDEKNDWALIAKYNIDKIEKFGIDTAGLAKYHTNNMIWRIFFEKEQKTAIIYKGIKYMETIVNANPENPVMIDTYANLLYKVGLAEKAVNWEKKAAKCEQKIASAEKRSSNKVYESTLIKMKKNIPTWPSK